MINKIHFKNYKSFKEKQDLELKPMTILIGKNSSGKSALAKLPTLIENSLKGNFKEPLLLENGGVELGAEFNDLIFGRKRIGVLEIRLEDEFEKLDITIGSGSGTTDSPRIFTWRLKNKFGDFIKGDIDNFKGFLYQSNEEKFKIKSLILPTEYIGPFRELPERGYNRPNFSKIEKVGITGKEAYPLLIQDFLNSEPILLNRVSEWFKENFDGWGLRVNGDKDPFYQIELTHEKANLNINIRDVGQGMSQVLPLVTRAFMETQNETLIIIEQPELHLHPGAHGDLAKLFVNSLKEKNRRYLIETHSQNFVLRLRRLVAEGKLNIEDLIIYFVNFNKENGTSSLEEIEVTKSGEVNNWPENVFNESLDEALAIRKAQKKIKDDN